MHPSLTASPQQRGKCIVQGQTAAQGGGSSCQGYTASTLTLSPALNLALNAVNKQGKTPWSSEADVSNNKEK